MPLCPNSALLLPDRYYVVVANAAARPTGGALLTGMMIYQADIASQLMWDGTGWIMMAEPAQSWTPVISNLTLGTGGTATGYYERADGWINFAGVSTLGSSGFSVGGALTLTLPIAALGLRTHQLAVDFVDNGGFRYPGTHDPGTTTCILYAINASGTYANNSASISATIPFTWAAGDAVEVSGRYRMTTRYS